MRPDPLADYPASAADEAVAPGGGLRSGSAVLGPVLRRLGLPGLAAAGLAFEAERRRRGVQVTAWADGRQVPQPFPQDPWPRVLPARDWQHLAAGVEQRHRALSAFLADAYRAAGRRRSDPDRDADVVRAGVLPRWVVTANPGRSPEAVELAWPGQPRATLAATDLVRAPDGRWLVVRDHLRAPDGLGHAVLDREVVRAAAPELCPAPGSGVAEAAAALPALRAALAAAAPPACPGAPAVAVLTGGPGETTYAEHRLLAEGLRVPLVQAGDLWVRADGGVEVRVDGARTPVDVLYRRFDDAALGAYRVPLGQPLGVVLAGAVRAGRLAVANVPGNGIAEDVTTTPYVPAMIRFYLGEEPLLPSVPTWVLADPEQWAQVRDRLHEMVVEPAESYGGPRAGVVVGPEASAARLAELHAEVSAAPHRFVAREPVEPSTLPALVGGLLRPRPTDLRIFSAAGPEPRALPAPLTRFAPEDGPGATDPAAGGGTKDTWLLTGTPPPG